VKKQMDQLKGRGKRAPQAARGIAEHPGQEAPTLFDKFDKSSGRMPKPRNARHG
jgi:hypothetical protein